MGMVWAKSVVTRVVVCFCIGGAALSISLSILEYRRSLSSVQIATSQQLVTTSHNLREVVRAALHDGGYRPLRATLDMFSQDPRVVGVRIKTAEGPIISSGQWPGRVAGTARWNLSAPDGEQGGLDLNRRTLLTSSLLDDGRLHTIQMLIDGPYIRTQMQARVLEHLSVMWIVLGLVALLALLMLRRWLEAPLTRIMGLTTEKAPAAHFERTAHEMPEEFGHLASSIASMLRNLDETTQELRQRETAFENLYEFAPAALLSVTPDGKISEANRRAVQLFGSDGVNPLIGKPVTAYIRPEDRARFRQSIDRLEHEPDHRCELRVASGPGLRDVDVEFRASYDRAGQLASVRLSMLDITESRRLIRQVSKQRRLLDLVVNHMSDGILLLGADGRIITANRRLGQLLRRRPDDMVGIQYDVNEFWVPLELTNPAAFKARMSRTTCDLWQPMQEQFESRDGAFLFQLMPVCDELGQAMAQLWVVQEVSSQVRSRRILDQQSAQLRALQRVSQQLHDIESVDDLVLRAMHELCGVFGVDVVGVAIRSNKSEQRQTQLIWQGDVSSPLPSGAAVAQGVRDQLMSRVLSQRATSLWTDLTQHDSWSGAFMRAGIEAMAATALSSREQTCGMIWIGRRGGKRIERRHLYLLEALAPMLAIALDNAQLRERVRRSRLTDPVTDLPSPRSLKSSISRLVNRPGHPWSLLVLDLDDFRRVNAQFGHRGANQSLRAVAACLRDTLRTTDQIVRGENDRFVVLCPDLDLPTAADLAERLRKAIEAMPLVINGQAVALTCSIGVAGAPNDHHGEDLTLNIATDRMRAAKQAGRNRVEAGLHTRSSGRTDPQPLRR